jgi:hypothetical protein
MAQPAVSQRNRWKNTDTTAATTKLRAMVGEGGRPRLPQEAPDGLRQQPGIAGIVRAQG